MIVHKTIRVNFHNLEPLAMHPIKYRATDPCVRYKYMKPDPRNLQTLRLHDKLTQIYMHAVRQREDQV